MQESYQTDNCLYLYNKETSTEMFTPLQSDLITFCNNIDHMRILGNELS